MRLWATIFLLSCVLICGCDGESSDVAALTSLSQVRLVNAKNYWTGRVEVFHPKFGWGTVCDDFWSLNDGHVVCRQLGFPGALRVRSMAYFGEGTGPILLDDVNCNGDESYVWDCVNKWNSHNCWHSEDAGVECIPPIGFNGTAKPPVTLSGQSYLLVFPRVFRAGTTVNVGVNIYGASSCDVYLGLFNDETASYVNQVRGHFQPDVHGTLQIQVPHGDINKSVKVDSVVAGVCGVLWSAKKVSYEAPKSKLFIQTDKPIYKPGQKVLMRIVHVNSELKPVDGKLSSVTIKESSGSKIMQWTDVQLKDGIASLDLQLSKEPVLGVWKIKAASKGIEAIKTIEIDKYVLPKFQLEVKPPAFLAWDEKLEIPVTVCARYTYGKDVTGRLETTICMKHVWRGNQECFEEVKNITGCEELNAIELLNRLKGYTWSYYGYQLHIKAKFVEILTGIERETEASSSRMIPYSKKMSFIGLADKFKPGFPFRFKIKISYVDGSPVKSGKIYVKVSRSRFYYIGSKELLEKTYSFKNGLVVVPLNHMPHDTETLNFKATYEQLNEFATSRAWYSPSLSYMKLVKSGTAKVDSQGSVKVLYTHRNAADNDITFNYEILCRGNLVLSGVTKNENLSTIKSQDILTENTTLRRSTNYSAAGSSLKYVTTKYITNYTMPTKFSAEEYTTAQKTSVPTTNYPTNPPTTEFQTFTPTTEYDGPTHPFINIPKPVVKEFELRFNVTQKMVPSCRILVYYVRSDKETVGDSVVYDIEDKLENQVSVDFAEQQKKPGEKTKIILKARPGSRVAISALDKSVLLLRSANDVKKSEVLRILSAQDVGRSNEYNQYDEKCGSSYWKPHAADASEAFNTAGVVFLSNLKIFTQPCQNNQRKFYEETERPVTIKTFKHTYWPTYVYGQLETTVSPTERLTAPPATYRVTEATEALTSQPATTEAEITEGPGDDETVTKAPSAATTESSNEAITAKKRTMKKVKVRKNFPETWLWSEVKLNGTSDMQTMEVDVPHSITSWVANGFAMSSLYGMGVSKRSTLKAFQPFFVQITLPYSVIRGEEIPVTVTVFNYLSSCVPIKLELIRQSNDFKVTSFYISKMCVCGDEGQSVKFRIIPHKLGHITLTVKAITSEADLCPSATVYAADAVKRKLLVEPEGIKQEYTRGTFFCPEKGVYNETIDLILPNDIISGSVLPKISVIGDVMGPALTNLDGLLAMPYGCGEQNMAKFAPNIYIMDYLTDTNQVTPKIKEDAIHYMNSGYQRELRYKRRSGSYSAFGDRDKQGSMMLTAFVVRSFARARRHVFIDEDQIKHSISWLKRMQRSTGCFPKYGSLFDRSLQGGVNSELTITAYVTIALLEAGLDKESTIVSKALDCVTKKINNIQDSYTISLVTYSLALAEHANAGMMLNRLRKKAKTLEGDQLFWSASSDKSIPETNYWSRWYQPPSADVEMTGYALMSYLKLKESIQNITKIIKWLSKQRNHYGGFSSTQDTCVALQALSEVAKKFDSGDRSAVLDISANIKDIFSRDFKVTSDNKLVLQRAEIPSNALPSKLEIAASGSRCALFQATVKYNIPVPEEVPAFKVDVSVLRREASPEEETTACYPLQLKISAKWLKEGVSNMAIVDVKLVSGFTVNEELLEEKMERSQNSVGDGEAILKRYEIEGQNVILYFDEIKTMSFSLDILQTTMVKKAKPGVVKVYDYYDTESQAKLLYNITEKDCYGEKIENECPKCISVGDFEDFFDKNIDCSKYLMRAKAINGRIKVRKGYIKTGNIQKNQQLPYEIPEFCPCEEIYNGVNSLVVGGNDYIRKNSQGTSIVFNAATTIAKWNSKKMKKMFREKMWSKIYRRCKKLAAFMSG